MRKTKATIEGATKVEQLAAISTIASLLPKLTRAQLTEVEVATRAAMGRLPFDSFTKKQRDYILAARDIHGDEGTCEIDAENAIVSEGGDPGAYVSAWVWVYDSDVRAWKKRNK